MDKVTNEEVLAKVDETRSILNTKWDRKHWWIGHASWRDDVLCNLVEGRMIRKLTKGRRRI